MRNRGLVAEPDTPVTIPVFATVMIVAMPGSSASKVNVAGMIAPPDETRAVVNICVWKPGGKLVDELLTSIQPISGLFTVSWTDAAFVMPLSTAVAVMDTGLWLAATPVTLPVASTVAIDSSLDDQPIDAVDTV